MKEEIIARIFGYQWGTKHEDHRVFGPDHDRATCVYRSWYINGIHITKEKRE